MFAALGIGFAIAAGFFGIGALLGLLYVLIRYGIPFIFWTLGLILDVLKVWVQAAKDGWNQAAEAEQARLQARASGISPQSQPENPA
jgi:hypothetical protein